MGGPQQLRVGGLLLRPWRASDAAAVDRAGADLAPGPCGVLPTSGAGADAWVTGLEAAWAAGRAAAWAVTAAADGALLGHVGLADLDRERPELTVCLAAPARGRGVASAAVGAVCGWALARGVPAVGWSAEVGDEAWWRVAHRAGFAFEGRRRAVRRDPDGRRGDAWVATRAAGVEPEPWPFEPFVGLSDGPLLLRRWRPADAPAWAALNADPDVLGWSGSAGPPASEQQVAAQIAGRFVEDFLLGRAARLAVCLDGLPVGGVTLRAASPDGPGGGSGELAWWLGPSARGRGLGTRAVRLVAGWGFERLGLRRISAGVHVDNAASQALAERVGFLAEGVRRRGAPAFGPGWGDAVAYGLLPTDLCRG